MMKKGSKVLGLQLQYQNLQICSRNSKTILRSLFAFALKLINFRMASIGVKTAMGRVLNGQSRVRAKLVTRTRKASVDLSCKLTQIRYLVLIPGQTGHQGPCTKESCLYLERDGGL